MSLLKHPLAPPKNARVLFVDMNGFFASIEQQDRPELRGKPVAVVGELHPRATILASSYEAKALDITTGTLAQEAQAICPEITILATRPERYRQVHRHFVGILEDLAGPEVQVKSIDEAAIYLPANWQTPAIALALALKIKSQFRQELGVALRCSIGIAPNTLLAKLGTELQKPDGLVEIELENIIQILSGLELTTLPGIADRMAARLEAIGIRSPLELYQTPPDRLRAELGIWGQYWWWRLHGYECDSAGQEMLKSMSHEQVLRHWIKDKRILEATVLQMVDHLTQRLYRNQLQCRFLWLSCRLVNAPSFTAEVKLDAPLADRTVLLERFRQLMQKVPPLLGAPVRKLAVGFSRLSPYQSGTQLDLWQPTRLTLNLSQTVGQLRERFGVDVIQPASNWQIGKTVQRKQIGFGQIRDR